MRPLLLLLTMGWSCVDPALSGDGQAPTVVPPSENNDTDSTTDDTGTEQPTLAPAVVLVIGDGMGPEHVVGGGLYSTGQPDGLFLNQAPHQTRIRTASMSGYTDSAAAATTLATGQRTWNQRIGKGADGRDLETLLDAAQARGMSTGVVTTDTVTGATPASFMVHAESRYQFDAIADAIALEPPDVLFGGGSFRMLERFQGDTVADGVPTVQLVTTAQGLENLEFDVHPLIGLFAPDTLPFVVDGRGEAPSLTTMAMTALSRLEQNPNGFVLIIESARIDHASHFNLGSKVHQETVELDETVRAIKEHSESWTQHELSMVVTADHECGGMSVEAGNEAGTPPTTSWRWGDHTNKRVGAYGWGTSTQPLTDTLGDHRHVHAALLSAITGEPYAEPVQDRLADGHLIDLGEPVVTQVHGSDQGGWTQLNALRVASDPEGLWIGIDGVFDDTANGVLAWVDLDVGQSTGVGADLELEDHGGSLDHIISSLKPSTLPNGLGFDAVAGTIALTDIRRGRLYDAGGLRLFHPPNGDPADLWWLPSVVIADFDRVADAHPISGIATGEADGYGLEMLLPWASLAPAGLPSAGATLGVAVTLSNSTADWVSNQALPPWAEHYGPSPSSLAFDTVVLIDVDGSGTATGEPYLAPQ